MTHIIENCNTRGACFSSDARAGEICVLPDRSCDCGSPGVALDPGQYCKRTAHGNVQIHQCSDNASTTIAENCVCEGTTRYEVLPGDRCDSAAGQAGDIYDVEQPETPAIEVCKENNSRVILINGSTTVYKAIRACRCGTETASKSILANEYCMAIVKKEKVTAYSVVMECDQGFVGEKNRCYCGGELTRANFLQTGYCTSRKRLQACDAGNNMVEAKGVCKCTAHTELLGEQCVCSAGFGGAKCAACPVGEFSNVGAACQKAADKKFVSADRTQQVDSCDAISEFSVGVAQCGKACPEKQVIDHDGVTCVAVRKATKDPNEVLNSRGYACRTGYAYNAADKVKKCELITCVTNCAICKDEDICLQCKKNHYLVGSACKKEGLSGGGIAGLVIAILLFVVLVCVAVCLFRKIRSAEQSEETEETEAEITEVEMTEILQAYLAKDFSFEANNCNTTSKRAKMYASSLL